MCPWKTPKQLEKGWIDRTSVFIGRGNDKLSEQTIKLYSERIRRAWKLIKPGERFKGKGFIYKNIKENIKIINESKMALSSKAGIYVAIASLFNKNTEAPHLNKGKKLYLKELKYWSDKVKEQDKKQINTRGENKKWKTPEQLEEGRKNLLEKAEKSKDILDYRDYVMFSLFTLLPPRRAADYGRMKITTNKDNKGNALVPQTHRGQKRFSKFVFNDFKLSEKKGSETFDRVFMKHLPRGKEILELLDGWLLMNPNGYLLVHPRETSHMSKAVARLSKKALGDPVNINSYRHMYVSNFLDKNPFLLEKEAIGAFMSHSLGQQEMYRKRIQKEDLEGFEREELEVKAEVEGEK